MRRRQRIARTAKRDLQIGEAIVVPGPAHQIAFHEVGLRDDQVMDVLPGDVGDLPGIDGARLAGRAIVHPVAGEAALPVVARVHRLGDPEIGAAVVAGFHRAIADQRRIRRAGERGADVLVVGVRCPRRDEDVEVPDRMVSAERSGDLIADRRARFALEQPDRIVDRLAERADEAVRPVVRCSDRSLEADRLRRRIAWRRREIADGKPFDAEAVAVRHLRARIRVEHVRLVRRRRVLEHDLAEVVLTGKRALAAEVERDRAVGRYRELAAGQRRAGACRVRAVRLVVADVDRDVVRIRIAHEHRGRVRALERDVRSQRQHDHRAASGGGLGVGRRRGHARNCQCTPDHRPK